MADRKCYQLTTKHLTKKGYACWRATNWNHFAKCSQDLGGIFDIIALKDGHGVLGVQLTDHTHRAVHRKKILESKSYAQWKGAGGYILLITWGNVGMKRGAPITCYEELL